MEVQSYYLWFALPYFILLLCPNWQNKVVAVVGDSSSAWSMINKMKWFSKFPPKSDIHVLSISTYPSTFEWSSLTIHRFGDDKHKFLLWLYYFYIKVFCCSRNSKTVESNWEGNKKLHTYSFNCYRISNRFWK